ncbi:MAG: TonB-dependent receptor, partial [Planctomycetaceae bacterium]|nr:TonB-dependent receptor [Planctomycetaceae bacterium]
QLATGAYAGSSFVNPDPDLDPETSINYELGMRMQSGNLVMDATAFYTESEDYIHHQVCTPEDNCPGRRDRTYLNIGESQAHGIELFLSYSNGPLGIEPYTNLTWMERENDYAEFSTTKTGIPSLSGRAGLRWEGQLWSIPALWSDFYLRGETGSKLEEPGTVRSVLEDKKGWVTVNVATGMDFGPDRAYQLSLELLNLGDKSYIASTENLYGVERTVAAKFS